MTRAEALILENQKLIMTSMSLLLFAAEVGPPIGDYRAHRSTITAQISKVQRELEEAKTWQE